MKHKEATFPSHWKHAYESKIKYHIHYTDSQQIFHDYSRREQINN